MQQVQSPSVDSLPRIGYYVSKEEQKQKFYKNESHIHKQGPLSGVKAGAHKLTNDILTYFPKGFSGSKNSDFYEYLSLGMVPYVVGSAMLIALYGAARGKFNATDAHAAGKGFRMMTAGVLAYGIGKWASTKLSRTLINASTGVDLKIKNKKKINELPEPGQEKGIVRIQYPGVYDSAEFFRKDLLAKDSEMNHGSVFALDDKKAKKAGFKEKLNNPGQLINEKTRKLKIRATAMENISKYVVAATGVAFGAQKAFETMKLSKFSSLNNIKSNAIGIFSSILQAGKQLWQGTDRNIITRNYGKVLIGASALTTLLAWLIPTIGFKTNPNTIKTKVDTNKEYEVC